MGVADPIELRRKQVCELYNIRSEFAFETAQELAAQPKFADFAINGTMDTQHVPTSLSLVEAGYDILLEKPFATSEEEMWQLVTAAKRNGCRIVICHVLRYAPFYTAIRQKVIEGAIGDVVNIQTVEHVSYHHMSVGFIRGKWNRKDRGGSSMLMSKCCHDMDLIAWMKSGVAPTTVASFGSNYQFRHDRAPERSGTRCVVDCPIEHDCLYSARKHFLDHPDRWAFYVWDSLEHIASPTLDDKLESLKTSPYGRCAWKCDNTVVDHQSVLVGFEDGSTATHNMVGGTSRPIRSIHLLGTTGEIQGVFEDSRYVVRHIDTRPGHEWSEKVYDLNASGDMHGAFGGHGGADLRLVADFLHVMRGEPHSISTTDIHDSVHGHQIGFCADRAMEQGRVVEIGPAGAR